MEPTAKLSVSLLLNSCSTTSQLCVAGSDERVCGGSLTANFPGRKHFLDDTGTEKDDRVTKVSQLELLLHSVNVEY